MAMGISSAAGSFGQFAMLPGTLALIGWLGWSSALLALGLLVALIVPLAGLMKDRPLPPQGHEQSLGERCARPARIPGSGCWRWASSSAASRWCSSAYTCRPTWSTSTCRRRSAPRCWRWSGCSTCSGTYIAGWLGGRWSKPRPLTALYLVRGVVIVLFLWLPLSVYSAYAFGVAMGLLWLSTVPLTNGTVATLFGVRNLSMLGGIVFLFHQLGAFLGGWLGGVVYDRTGSYDLVWQLSILLSLLAALLNWPVRERPVARLQVAGRRGVKLAWLLAAGALLGLAWWGWQRGGLALLELGMGAC